MASIDRPSLIRPSAPRQRSGDDTPVGSAPKVSLVRGAAPKVSLVRQPAAKVSLVRRPVEKVSLVRRTPVNLTKRVNLAKRARPFSDPWTSTRPPVRSHRRSRLSPTQVFVAASTGASRSARATRAWARRPAGRMVLPGLLMAVLVAVAAAGGAWLPQVTGNKPIAASPSDEELPSDGAGLPGELPSDPPADGEEPVLPSQDPSAPPAAEQNAANTLAAWAAPLAVRTNIPLVALEAYALAELTVAQTHPNCGLRWTTLAGIGRNESNHGQTGNATLGTDGRSTPPIYGPPLDGTNNNKAINDTDDGQLDGDEVWDRAIGPMQFIPTTWRTYAVDADGDGRSDPHDIDDAALASARYLCGGNRNLATAAGWKAAILAYNNVEVYATNVFNAANDYGLKSRT